MHVILGAIDSRIGSLEGVDTDPLARAPRESRLRRFCTRFAASFGQLLCRPDLTLTPFDFELLALYHPWLEIIFGLSGFSSADHLLPVISGAGENKQWKVTPANLPRLLTAYSPGSQFQFDFEQCWRARPAAAATAYLQYLASRCVFSDKAFDTREYLLEWIPVHLEEIKLGQFTLSAISPVYMHCSYAMSQRKHEIKSAMMRQMRRACLEAGRREMETPPAAAPGKKPTIVVVAEYFNRAHSVFRTHSEAVRALRERFHVVGVVHLNPDHKAVEDYFDEIISVKDDSFFDIVRSAAADILARSPAIVLYLSVGMLSKVVALASLRLAPVQVASYGHAATTMSPVIDYMILPEDIVGAPETYSEKIIALPREAMPFVPPVMPEPPPKRTATAVCSPVRVAIPASLMKLNPPLFATLALIAKEAKTEIDFRFLSLSAIGLSHLALKDAVRRYFPKAVVYEQASRKDYYERLAQCEVFLSPFPFGNTNGIVDALILGIPGVCLDGPQIHAHIDASLLARAGLPGELVTHTVDEYVAAAVTLVDDAGWRAHCQALAEACDMQAAFSGAIQACLQPHCRA